MSQTPSPSVYVGLAVSDSMVSPAFYFIQAESHAGALRAAQETARAEHGTHANVVAVFTRADLANVLVALDNALLPG